MEFFKIRRDIPFMRHALTFNIISLLTFLLAVGFLAVRGLNFSIEFTGGTVMEVSYKQAANVEEIRAAIEKKGWGEFQVQNFGTSRDVMIRLPVEKGYTSGQQAERVMETLKAQEYEKLLNRILRKQQEVGIELKPTCAPHFMRIAKRF